MTDHLTNEEREALIAGDRAGALEPDETAELTLLASLLADPSTWAEPSTGLEDTIVHAVADATPAIMSSGTSVAAGALRETAHPRRRIALSAVAAAAAIVIVVAALTLTGGGTSPDYTVQLSATALAPGARASADISRNDAGFRITLDARGLPLLREGDYYQAWLKNPAGALVPIGTFSSSDGRITLWSGVSPKDFATITVTIEANDNDQASSGRRVLVGEVRAR